MRSSASALSLEQWRGARYQGRFEEQEADCMPTSTTMTVNTQG